MPITPQSGYEFWLTDDRGVRLEPIIPWEAEYTMALNDVGTFGLTIGADDVDLTKLAVDRRIEISRQDGHGRFAPEFSGFIRRRVFRGADDPAGDVFSCEIGGYDANDLLRRRIVAYAAGTAQADKTGLADVVMKELVRENLGVSASGARVLSSTYFAVDANLSLGATVTVSAARRLVLDCLQECAEDSRVGGTPVWFGLVPTPVNGALSKVTFRVATGQWGADRGQSSASPVVLSIEANSLSAAALELDWSDEDNTIYALGPSGALAAPVQDVTRAGASMWARSERFVSASREDEAAGITAVAQAELGRARARERFTATVNAEAPGAMYGRDWWLGDKVAAAFRGRTYDAVVRQVRVVIAEDGFHTVETRLEFAEAA